MGICKLCLKEAALIDAHIIPKSLYGPMREDSRTPRLYSTENGSFPKKVPAGIYDRGILCADCDRRIGDWDNYAQQLLLAPLENYGDPVDLRALEAFVIPSIDYTRLKLFFISLIWRAHQATHPFFQDIDLGPWVTKARSMILTGDPGEPDDFGVLLVRHEHPLAARTFYNPERTRPAGLNYYRFGLGCYVAMIKVDSRPLEGPQRAFLLRPGADLLVALFEYEDSRIYEEIIQRMKRGAFKFRSRNIAPQNTGGRAGD